MKNREDTFVNSIVPKKVTNKKQSNNKVIKITIPLEEYAIIKQKAEQQQRSVPNYLYYCGMHFAD